MVSNLYKWTLYRPKTNWATCTSQVAQIYVQVAQNDVQVAQIYVQVAQNDVQVAQIYVQVAQNDVKVA